MSLKCFDIRCFEVLVKADVDLGQSFVEGYFM